MECNGNVGIGTDSPSNYLGWDKVLDVRGNGNSKILATTSNETYRTGIFAHDSTVYWNPGGYIGTESNHNLYLVTNMDTRMTILKNGNIGIGFSSPAEKLHINGSIRGSQTGGCIRLNSNYKYVDIGGKYSNGHHIQFLTNAYYGYYFDKGIEVVGGSFSSFTGDLTLAISRSPVVWVKSANKYVGIGDNTPSYKLDVNGDIQCVLLHETSDERLKKDILDIDEQTINNLYYLQAKSYIIDNSLRAIENEIISELNDTLDIEEFNEIEIDTTPKIGFIAQQLMEYFPNLVSQDNEGFYSISYTSLIPVIVEALKDQKEIIENLEYEINLMRSESSDNLKSELITTDDNLSEQTEKPILFQNKPNPFDNDTEIRFYLPEGINNAKLYIYNIQGNQLRSINITQRGYGSEIVHGSLQPGMYIYTLITNGLEVDTKRMILTD